MVVWAERPHTSCFLPGCLLTYKKGKREREPGDTMHAHCLINTVCSVIQHRTKAADTEDAAYLGTTCIHSKCLSSRRQRVKYPFFTLGFEEFIHGFESLVDSLKKSWDALLLLAHLQPVIPAMRWEAMLPFCLFFHHASTSPPQHLQAKPSNTGRAFINHMIHNFHKIVMQWNSQVMQQCNICQNKHHFQEVIKKKKKPTIFDTGLLRLGKLQMHLC